MVNSSFSVPQENGYLGHLNIITDCDIIGFTDMVSNRMLEHLHAACDLVFVRQFFNQILRCHHVQNVHVGRRDQQDVKINF